MGEDDNPPPKPKGVVTGLEIKLGAKKHSKDDDK